jgi:CSLREA domain-containing protein
MRVTRFVKLAALATLFTGVASLSLSMQPAEAGLVLVVDSSADASDANPGDGICGTPQSPDPSPTPTGPGPFLAQVQPGTCTLRAAIEEANATAGQDTITFSGDCIDFSSGDICGPGGFIRTIGPGSQLPAIVDPLIVEGPRPPDAVVLNGASAGNADGLRLQATRKSIVRGLVINGFSGAGIFIAGGNENAIEGNLIGTDENGVEARPNAVGIRINDSIFNVVGGNNPDQRNVISGNSGGGVEITGADANGNHVIGNYIGTNVSADGDLGNGGAGVVITSPILRENGNVIGQGGEPERNVISGNGANGVLISGGGANEVSGNYIGTDGTGSFAIPNALSGVEVGDSFRSEIGGPVSDQRNVISGNLQDGISISDGASGTQIEGNYIGTDAGGTIPIPNNVGVFVNNASQTIIGGEPSQRNVISGNERGGVELSFDSETYVQGNFIGTNAEGTGALPNGIGVEIRGLGGFGNTRIGGSADGTGNVISGNSGFGVAVFDARGITMQGNRIGTDIAGASAVPNGQSGVLIERGEFNLIGGDQPGAGNLISGNGGSGVTVFESYSNTVQGNLIGTDVSGSAAVGNGFAGVHVEAVGEFDSKTLIGGSSPAARNLISGNEVGVLTDEAMNTVVEGNLIGTDLSGAEALGNSIGIALASRFNRIGGAEPGTRNVISGNAHQGVTMDATVGDASLSTILGNYIGVDASGSAPLGNEVGVEIAGLQQIAIGGPEAGAGNVISGNRAEGLVMKDGAFFNSVQGNYVGTDSSGTVALPNLAGVSINQSSDNLVGGTEPGARNLISGNGGFGIEIFGDSARRNAVQGNYVGTDTTGTVPVGNGTGISIGDAIDNLIGGSVPGARNVVSGNSRGIGIFGNGGNTVKGNYVGTDASGEARLDNIFEGITLEHSSQNVIGGSNAADRNVVSANQWGVWIRGFSNANVVAGNYIGTNASGSSAMGNRTGIIVGEFSENNTIGGAGPSAGNVIAGSDTGVEIIQASNGNTLQGNFIGTDRSGAADLGNEAGISIDQADKNMIGGVAAGSGNTIAHNRGNGVHVFGAFGFAVGNSIRGNSIYSNGGKGISNIPERNQELPPPVINSAGSAAGTACAGCTIDVYSDNEDEARVYHGSTLADSNGDWSFAGAVVGPHVTATATDTDGTTSEFSEPFACVDTDGDGVCDSGDATPLGECAGMAVTIRGSDGPDKLIGTSAADVIAGAGGDDVIKGGDGDDVICGGGGDDLIRGDNGRDNISGDEGNDRLEGDKDDDLLNGGSGWDRCFGGEGRDVALNCEKRSSIS